jgi:hypothetical protein
MKKNISILIMAITSLCLCAQADIQFEGGNGTPLQITFTADLVFTMQENFVANQTFMLVIPNVYTVAKPTEAYLSVVDAGRPELEYNGSFGPAREIRIDNYNDIHPTDLWLNFNALMVAPKIGETLTVTAGTAITDGIWMQNITPDSMGLRDVFLVNWNSGLRKTDKITTMVEIVSVPEPASALMIGFGGLLVVGYRRICKFFGRF